MHAYTYINTFIHTFVHALTIIAVGFLTVVVVDGCIVALLSLSVLLSVQDSLCRVFNLPVHL